jgi:hypothetical protein
MKAAGKPAVRVERPVVALMADGQDARALDTLFARRGFITVQVASQAELQQVVAPRARRPSAIIIDLAHPEAQATLGSVDSPAPRPALIGIAAAAEAAAVPPGVLDGLFVRPVDPAKLFVQVVELVSVRRTGRRRRKLSGIVGAVNGNDLFMLVAHELSVAVPAVNASAVLEGALRALGTGPFVLKSAEIEAMIASGRLAAALDGFGSSPVIKVALKRVLAAIRARNTGSHAAHK